MRYIIISMDKSCFTLGIFARESFDQAQEQVDDKPSSTLKTLLLTSNT